MYGLESSRGFLKGAHRHDNFLALSSHLHSRAIYGQQVIGVVLSDESAPEFHSVDFEKRALHSLLHYLATVVGYAVTRIGDHARLSVLDHHAAVSVVYVSDGHGAAWKRIEEGLLTSQVFREGSVVVQVVVGEVREDAYREFERIHSVLIHSDGTNFHKTELASAIHHLREQLIDGQWVCRRIRGLQASGADIIGNRGKKPALVAEPSEQVV